MNSLGPTIFMFVFFNPGSAVSQDGFDLLCCWGLPLNCCCSCLHLQRIGSTGMGNTPSFCRAEDRTQHLLPTRQGFYWLSHIPGLGPVISKWSLLSLSSRFFASLPLAGWFPTINSINPCLSGDRLLMTLRMAQSKSGWWDHSDISREAVLVFPPKPCATWDPINATLSLSPLPPRVPWLPLGSRSPVWTNNLGQICRGVKRKSMLRVKIIQESIFSAVLWSIEITLSLFPFFSAWEANCFDCGDMS